METVIVVAQTTVVNCHTTMRENYDIYVGRGSKWGNQFVIGKDGTREQVIAEYRAWIATQPALIDAARTELKGKVLGCWCALLACHADVLAEIANEAPCWATAGSVATKTQKQEARPKCSKCGNTKIRCFVTNIGSCSLWCDSCGHHSVRYLSNRCGGHCKTPKPVRCTPQCRRCQNKMCLVRKPNGSLKLEFVINMPCRLGIVPNQNVKCQSWKEVTNNERSKELLGQRNDGGVRSSQSRNSGTLPKTSGQGTQGTPEYAKKSKQVGSFNDYRNRHQPGNSDLAGALIDLAEKLPEDEEVWYELVPKTKQDGLLPV